MLLLAAGANGKVLSYKKGRANADQRAGSCFSHGLTAAENSRNSVFTEYEMKIQTVHVDL